MSVTPSNSPKLTNNINSEVEGYPILVVENSLTNPGFLD